MLEVFAMLKGTSDAQLVHEEPIFRVESIPPPDGEDVHSCETKLGDWALALAEKERASAAVQPTAKVSAFDLAAALAKTKAKSITPPAPPAPPPAPAAAMTPAVAVLDRPCAAPVVEELPPRAPRSATAVALAVLEILFLVGFVAASAVLMRG